MRLLRHLIPQVAHLTQDQSGADELQIIQFIRRTTMVRWTCDAVWWDGMWFDLIWFDVIWCDLMWFDVMRCDIISYHMMSQYRTKCFILSSLHESYSKSQYNLSSSIQPQVGLLPVPHPIIIRKYQPNRYTCLWFTAFQWGVIFMHNQTVPLFDGKKVKLFMVQTVHWMSNTESTNFKGWPILQWE